MIIRSFLLLPTIVFWCHKSLDIDSKATGFIKIPTWFQQQQQWLAAVLPLRYTHNRMCWSFWSQCWFVGWINERCMHDLLSFLWVWMEEMQIIGWLGRCSFWTREWGSWWRRAGNTCISTMQISFSGIKRCGCTGNGGYLVSGDSTVIKWMHLKPGKFHIRFRKSMRSWIQSSWSSKCP